MTGLLHEKEFSRSGVRQGRRRADRRLLDGSARPAGRPPASAPRRARSTATARTTRNALDSWLAVHPDNTVSVKLGMVELGQGSTTGLLMIAAEELNLPMSQMKMISNDTDMTPNQGGTYGSEAVHVGGMQTRAAAAAAYQALLGLASTQLGVPGREPVGANGVVSGGGKQVTYGQLIGGKLFNVEMPAGLQPRADPAVRRARPLGRCRSQPGSASDEADLGLHARRHEPGPAADRHPGEGDRHVHLRPEHPRAGNAPRADRAAARPGRLRRRHEPAGAVGRRRPRSATSRASRSSRRATSSASSHRRSTTRSRPRPS